MKKLIFCISGFSGAGKDEVAKRLVEKHECIHIGLTDSAKSHMADIYGFNYEQLFGASEFRNSGDVRIPKNNLIELIKSGAVVRNNVKKCWEFKDSKNVITDGNRDYYLSPREALQIYCETMNNLNINTWVKKGIDTHNIITSANVTYSRMTGIQHNTNTKIRSRTCFSDFRHIHEVVYVRGGNCDDATNSVLIRVKRPSVQKPPYDHRSEKEQTRIRDSAFDFVVNNNGTIDDLYKNVDSIVSVCVDGNFRSKPFKPEYILSTESDYYIP